MFRVVVGQAESIDTAAAADVVILQCRAQLGTLEPVAGLIFASSVFDHGL